MWRVRGGDYRILYAIEDQRLIVVVVREAVVLLSADISRMI